MGIQNELNVICTTRKTLLHLTMLTSIVAAAALTTGVAGKDHHDAPSTSSASTLQLDNHIQELPFCGDRNERNIGRRLLYISTLDGRLSALDITKEGKRRWSIPTGPGPLVSSSIHRLELTNNGQFVRMIPSLSGGIYKFDGESIDPIPINAENLLSSSTKFSDDLVISGGKETRTYGVSTRTGQLLYECSMHGCANNTNDTVDANKPVSPEAEDETVEGYLKEHDPLVDDVIVVRRQTQTVRAVESRSGVERWNFSVGQHDLDFVRPSECHDIQYSELDMAVLDLDVKVIVPEGLICAFSKSEPGVMLWKHKFDHPIVSAWKIGLADEIESIDMFGSAQWLWDEDNNIFEPLNPTLSPSIYLGMYDKQLYIQESVQIRKEIMDQTNLYNQLTTNDIKLPKIPWRPIAATSNSMMVVKNERVIGGVDGGGGITHRPQIGDPNLHGNELVPYDEENFAISAQSVLNASEYVNGNGFYLYTREDLNKPDRALCDSEENNSNNSDQKQNNDQEQYENMDSNANNNTVVVDDLGFSLDDIDAPVKVVILSLWFWWKEIVVIAFTSAILLNLFIGQRQRPEREIVVIERHIPVPTAMEATESSTAALLGPPTTNSSKSLSNGLSFGQRSLSESTSHSSETFSSRFQGDFDLMQCLGRGGFGVVFEAKNKLDDCKYAIKRITLPNKKESRDRVMREVKTLANCEHHNIVRYFQAWVENPPPGWQEEEDGKWLAQEMSTSIQIETPDGTTLPSFASSAVSDAVNRRKLHVEKKKQLLSWVSSVTSTACSNDPNDIDHEDDDDDDSCIVFATESQSLAMKEDESENECCVKKLKNGNNSISDGISIDIHSKSFDLGLQNGKNLDYSQLSDSFQIEFVRSTSGGQSEWENSHANDEDESKSAMKSKNKLSLDLSLEHNNNCKALIPVRQNTPPDKPIKPIQNKVYLYIQMQLCRKESLRDWLRDNRTAERAQHIPSIFHQIVNAVDYVHLKGLIHRDLKPSNIFFSQDGQIKIGDFGLVTDMSDIPNMITKCGDNTGLPSCLRHTQQVGTHLYMSPEQLRGQPYDYKVDIYSLGLIFFELLVYFNTEMERILTLRDLRDDKFPKDFPVRHPEEYDLLKCMLSAQPSERPATMELKQQLSNILILPDDLANDNEAANVIAEAARRLRRSRTFSTSE